MKMQPPLIGEPIYQQGDISLTMAGTMESAALTLLERTVYGTSGIRYVQTGQAQKLPSLYNPLFFHLFWQDKLIGIYCLDERSVSLGQDSLPGYYGRYLAIEEQYKGNGYGRLLKQQAIAYTGRHVSSPHLYYSLIEEKNSRSMRISESEGFVSIAQLKTFIFRRYAPQLDPRFRPVLTDELTSIRHRLTAVYERYRLRTLGRIGYQGNYFVIQEGDELLAGIQANPVRWQFETMPGLGGWVTMNLLPLTPLTRRFFDPAKYAFLVLEGLFIRPGREDLLPVLLESVLGHFNLNSALWQLDEQDPIHALLADRSMGPLSGYQKGVRTHVLVKPVEVPAARLTNGHPVYISCFDFS